ncbi:MAG TPA: carboxymuconolactone decarboxylase family protein [Acidimicrobiales bacterium]
MTDAPQPPADADADAGVELPAWPHPDPPLRIPPVGSDEVGDETAQLLEGLKFDPEGPVPNLFATLAHHPRLLKRWSAFGGTLLFRSELSNRERELLILRTAWRCKAHYEWSHHVPLALRVGVTKAEIARVVEGPDAPGWDPVDAALVRAADELHADAVISDATWAVLAGRYTPAQLVEIPMVVGQYHLVAFTLNSLGVQLDHDEVAGPERSGHQR